MSTNLVILDGRLGQKPELINFQSGTNKCSFSIATNETYLNNEGKEVELTEWHEIAVWGKRALACNEFLDKGARVIVRGSIRTEKFQNKEGKDIYKKIINAERVDFISIPSKASVSGEESINDSSLDNANSSPFKDYAINDNETNSNVPF